MSGLEHEDDAKTLSMELSGFNTEAGLFDMALKNLGFLYKNLKNLKIPNLGFLGFLKNKNLMSDLSF